MGWAYCGTDYYGREIGYGIEATCDKRGCDNEIDRGLGYICGSMHHGPFDMAVGCGRYYCGEHEGAYQWEEDEDGEVSDEPTSCTHSKFKRPWGKTKCQLLMKDVTIERWYDHEKQRWDGRYGVEYYCACHGWSAEPVERPEPDPHADPWDDPTDPLNDWRLLPDFVKHVEKRGFASKMREMQAA